MLAKIGRFASCLCRACCWDSKVIRIWNSLTNLPYNRMLLFVVSNEFAATQWYVPTSCFCKFRMIRSMLTEYGDFFVVLTSWRPVCESISPAMNKKTKNCFYSWNRWIIKANRKELLRELRDDKLDNSG